MDFQQVSDWIASRQDEMVELQRELTARPALGPENGGKGEWEKARFLQEYLAAHGLNQVRHFDCPDDRVPEGTRPNFSVTIQAGEPGPRQWIMSHMDVVPPGERLPDGSWKGWGDDPWEVQLLDDMVVGRGVSDNQQAIISSVFAARALVENGLKPVREVKLLFVSDEETGSRHGLIHVLQQDGGPFLKDDPTRASTPAGPPPTSSTSWTRSCTRASTASIISSTCRTRRSSRHATMPTCPT
jgi:succinyl-diaminopimelate desuccinylase